MDPGGGTSYSLVETRQIHSVPLALHSQKSDAISAGKLVIMGDETQNPEEALFEVMRSDGQTVFAVYPDGARIYIEDLPGKGSKGGFAVGGFDPYKGVTDEYLRVTPDSVRVYINESLNKGSKGGFAVGGFEPSKGLLNQEYLRVTTDSVRIYVDNNPVKGSKGGFAVGGFSAGKESPVPFVNLTPKNYFIGYESGKNITTGSYNSFIGFEAGKMNKDGDYNIFIGHQAGLNNLGPSGGVGGSYGSFNCYLGYQTGYANEHGCNNTLIGYSSGWNNRSDNNTFIGSLSGINNTSGYSNTFLGTESGQRNTTGNYNVLVGRLAGTNVREGSNNTCVGTGAGANIRSGNQNIIIGIDAMGENLFAGDGTGSENIMIGYKAGYTAHNCSSNVFIGNQAGMNETGSNLLIIENSSSVTPLIHGNFLTDVFRVNGNIEASGTINQVSDIRLKKNISPLTGVIDKLNVIQGISYEWDLDNDAGVLLKEGKQIGVIAQEVEEVFPELVTTNEKGYKMVDYIKLTPILLEVIKEQQQAIELLRSRVSTLESMIEQNK